MALLILFQSQSMELFLLFIQHVLRNKTKKWKIVPKYHFMSPFTNISWELCQVFFILLVKGHIVSTMDSVFWKMEIYIAQGTQRCSTTNHAISVLHSCANADWFHTTNFRWKACTTIWQFTVNLTGPDAWRFQSRMACCNANTFTIARHFLIQ